MKALLFVSILLFFACSTSETQLLVACGDDKAIIIDEAASSGKDVKVIWSWSVYETNDLPLQYEEWMIPLDECKPVDNGSKLLLTSSGGGAVLVDIKTRKSLFYARVPMAHSAEMLPDGRIVVALSTHKEGNSIELYDATCPEVVLYKDSLYSGHGVVWNAKREVLYALGYDELRAYALKDWKTQQPSLQLQQTWTLPDKGGHDLMLTSEDRLIISTNKNVWTFNPDNQEFAAFPQLENESKIKSVNYDPESGQLIYTQGEIEWWTHHIYLRNPDKTLEISDINLYKVRTL